MSQLQDVYDWLDTAVPTVNEQPATEYTASPAWAGVDALYVPSVNELRHELQASEPSSSSSSLWMDLSEPGDDSGDTSSLFDGNELHTTHFSYHM